MKKTYEIYDNTSDNFEDWKEEFLADRESEGEPTDLTEEELWERYSIHLRTWAYTLERSMNRPVEGVIVGYADLGLWNGRFIGAKLFGGNVSSIMTTCDCDYIRLYADRHNVKSELYHHDGTNYVTYRIAKDMETAREIVELASRGKLTWEYFRKKTKPLLGIMAEIMEWELGKPKKVA